MQVIFTLTISIKLLIANRLILAYIFSYKVIN